MPPNGSPTNIHPPDGPYSLNKTNRTTRERANRAASEPIAMAMTLLFTDVFLALGSAVGDGVVLSS